MGKFIASDYGDIVPLSVYSLSIFGVPISDVVQFCMLIYVVFGLVLRAPKVLREVKSWFDK